MNFAFLKDTKVRVVLAVVVILLVFLLYKFVLKRSTKEKAVTKNKRKTKRKPQSKRAAKRAVEEDEEDDEDNNEDDDKEVSPDVRGDAEELYNLAHEGLAKGIQKSAFMQLVGDLADDYTFIQLKQLYKDREDRNMDPLKSITVTDYIKILQNE